MLLSPPLLLLYNAFDTVYFLYCPVVHSLLSLSRLSLQFKIACIVALIFTKRPVFHFESRIGDLIEKITVVRYYDICTLIFRKELFEPFAGGYIKVVRRLVKKQYIAPRKKQLRKLCLAFLPTAHYAYRLVEILFGKSQTDKCRASHRFIGKSALTLKSFL